MYIVFVCIYNTGVGKSMFTVVSIQNTLYSYIIIY